MVLDKPREDDFMAQMQECELTFECEQYNIHHTLKRARRHLETKQHL